MLLRSWWIVGLAAVAGCSSQATTECEPNQRYAAARSAPPVQIPDDLSPPNDSNALRLPPDAATESSIVAGECLETPPSFFGDARPFRQSAQDDDERESRRERRRRERQEQAEEAPPPPPSPPASEDRVIDN